MNEGLRDTKVAESLFEFVGFGDFGDFGDRKALVFPNSNEDDLVDMRDRKVGGLCDQEDWCVFFRVSSLRCRRCQHECCRNDLSDSLKSTKYMSSGGSRRRFVHLFGCRGKGRLW